MTGVVQPWVLIVLNISTTLFDYVDWLKFQERELGLIMLDHSYSKPFNWRPEIGFGAKPTRYLFSSNEPRAQGATSPTQL